jgi:catalase
MALGLKAMPKPADAALPTRQNLDPSPALSIIAKGPQRFEGRKLGILITEGTDAKLFNTLKKAITDEGATFEVIAPRVGGATASDGEMIEADQTIDGGPSVLYDAIALLPGAAAIDALLKQPAVRDFIADAFAHCKFIGYAVAAAPLFKKAGIEQSQFDEGFISLTSPADAGGFVAKLAKLRVWDREPKIGMH